jgi:sugar O-acyltransferase (sialic acid O-acetyltransferase NeuD family)
MTDLVLFGTGDFARIARVYFEQDSEYDVIAFTVNEEYISEPTLNGLPVVPFESLEESYPPDRCEMFVAAGFSKVNQVRAGIFEQARERGYELATYICSKAIRWGPNEFGANTFVFESNVVQPYVTIGDDTVLWSGNHIGHDSRIGNHVFIASHAVISGNCSIGDYCFVGVNATFRDGVTVADRCVVGAGALIMKDTEEGAVYSVRGTEPLEKKSWDLKGF